MVKKPCARSASLPTRSVFEAGRGPRDEEGRQGGNEGESARAGEREEGSEANVHTRTYTRVGNAFATTVVRCQTKAAPSLTLE